MKRQLAWAVCLWICAGCAEQQKDGGPVSAESSRQVHERLSRPQSSKSLSADHRAVEPNASSSPADTSIRFAKVGSESGFVFQRYDDMKGQRRILEVNGGGVAIFDFDQDGWLDVFMTNGCRLPLAVDSRETPGKLFRNLTRMKFEDCSEQSGLMQYGFCYGCASADSNEDGFDDLYLTAIGGNQFWINNGDGTFTETAEQNGTRGHHWGSSAAFADLNSDHCLDLYVANYLDESDVNPRLCPEPLSPDGYAGCSPALFEGVADTLFLSDGMGGYIDASEAAGLLALPGKSLGVVICDLDGDLSPEVYVANDGEPNYLLTIQPGDLLPDDSGHHGIKGIHFTNQAVAANAALNDQGYAQASMGIAAADFDHNGATDLFLTHFYGDTNTLYLNRSQTGTLLFEDATRASLLGPPSRSRLAFGVVAIDADNNGWKDLLVANGHVDDRSWLRVSEPYEMPAQVFENLATRGFRNISRAAGPYFEEAVLGRGVATGDLDRDGRIDVVISNQLQPSVILRNETECAGAATLRVVGISGCRTPFGAKVLRAEDDDLQVETLNSGGSFQSASSNELHISLQSDRYQKVKLMWRSHTGGQDACLSEGLWIVGEGRGEKNLPM